MRLTTMTDYALRLLVYVAQHPERLCTIGEVAQAYGISQAHLMKITDQLGRLGWIETVRGKGGGMRLAVRPRTSMSARWCAAWSPTSIWSSASPRAAPACSRGAAGWPACSKAPCSAFLEHLDGFTLADALQTTGVTSIDWRHVNVHPGAPP